MRLRSTTPSSLHLLRSDPILRVCACVRVCVCVCVCVCVLLSRGLCAVILSSSSLSHSLLILVFSFPFFFALVPLLTRSLSSPPSSALSFPRPHGHPFTREQRRMKSAGEHTAAQSALCLLLALPPRRVSISFPARRFSLSVAISAHPRAPVLPCALQDSSLVFLFDRKGALSELKITKENKAPRLPSLFFRLLFPLCKGLLQGKARLVEGADVVRLVLRRRRDHGGRGCRPLLRLAPLKHLCVSVCAGVCVFVCLCLCLSLSVCVCVCVCVLSQGVSLCTKKR